MFGLIAAAAGTGLGLLQGRKDSKNAKKASDKSLAMQKNQLAFDQKRYNDAQEQYLPIENSLLAMAKQGVNPDYEGTTTRTIGDINSQFDGSEAARVRSMRRQGVNPNSGRADAMARNLSLTRALSLAGGINKANTDERYRADELNWNRLYNANALGTNKMNATTAAVSNSQTNLSNTYANTAATLGAQSSALYGGAGQLAGSWLSGLGA